MKRALLLAAALTAGCEEKAAPPLSALAPRPLPRVDVGPDAGADREAAYRVEPSPVQGEPLPADALTVELSGTTARLGPAAFDLDKDVAGLVAKLGAAPVLLAPDGDTFLAQAAPLLAALEEKGVWLLHPSKQVAYRLRLRDEAAFQKWLDEAKPGKIRIIQRADGLELQTNIGKLPGVDANGPTVPLRGGQLDIATLRRALVRLRERFDTAPDLCLVPSYGTELAKSAEVLSGDYSAPGKRIFDELCLVYPRPTVKH